MNRAAAIIAAILMAIAVTGWQGYRLGVQAEVARTAVELIKRNAENAAKQKVLIKSVERIAENAEIERTEIEVRLAGADDAVERLRAEIRSADGRANAAATAIADATTARAQLAHCAAEYRDMAKRADQLRSAVIGLQSYARTVSEEPN
jgi:chromosome segregation ATPase